MIRIKCAIVIRFLTKSNAGEGSNSTKIMLQNMVSCTYICTCNMQDKSRKENTTI